MAYEFDYQGTGGALGLGFQPEGMKWGNGAPPPGYVPNTRPGALGIPFKESTPVAGTPKTAPFVPNMAGAAAGAAMGTVPTPSSLPKFKNTNEIADYAHKTQIVDKLNTAQSPAMTTPTGSGYAMVGGQRVNYADIGTKSDPLSRGTTGGWVMGNGGAMGGMAPDQNMGLAAQDAQQRQSALDMSGVGAGGTYPRSLESRLRGIQGNGEGALMEAIVQSKIAKSDYGRFNKDRKAALDLEQIQNTNDYNMGNLDLNRQRFQTMLPLDMEERRSAIDLRKIQGQKEQWEMTPEGVAARRGNQGNPALESGMAQAIHGAKTPMEVARNQRWYALQTSGQGYEAPETNYQFDDGQGGVKSYKMYGMLHREQYPAYRDTVKFLHDATNAYNQSRRDEKDFAALQRARAAAVNKYRSLGLAFDEIDPSKAIAATE